MRCLKDRGPHGAIEMAYSDIEKAEALIKLALNGYDWEKTATETGICKMTLRRWNKIVPKKGVGELLERALARLLMAIPKELGGQEWSVAVGILMDKWLVMQGQPTNRIETVGRGLRELSDDEYYAVLAEAERILHDAASGRVVDPGGAGSG